MITLMEMLVVLLASPLVATLIYGSYRFHTDPDGAEAFSAPIRRRPNKDTKDVQPQRSLSTAAAT